MTSPRLPAEPLRISSLPPAGGTLGPNPEDFVVDEIPLYAPSGSGDHLYVRVQKRGLTTPELVQRVARAAGVKERDVGYAGLKDKHAVTRQWLSLPIQARPADEWELPDSIELVEVTRHNNKLRTGHLTGNRFTIRVVEVPEGGCERARAIAAALQSSGLPNYFGEQRFGYAGKNLDHATQWLARPPARNRKKSRFHDKLYPSVLQAEVFNRYLTARAAFGFEQLIQGEVVRLAGSGSVFVVEDVEAESPRLAQNDIVLTGPLFGPRAVAARHTAADLEAEAVATLGFETEQLDRLGKSARGTRRDLVVSLDDLTFRELGSNAWSVSFSLPAGSYATQLLRELTGSQWLGQRAPSVAGADASEPRGGS